MRVLHLTPELPYAPGGTGGSTRQYHLLRRLVELGHAIEVVAPVHPEQVEGAQLLRDAGVTLRGLERPGSRVAEVLTAARRRPHVVPLLSRLPVIAWQVEIFWTSLRRLALDSIATTPPDVIAVEHDWAARWARDLPPGTPRSLTLHNLSWEYYEARARAAEGWRARTLRVEARRFLDHDRRLLQEYGLLVAMSDRDAQAVAAQGITTSCAVVPNGVDVGAFSLDEEPEPSTVLFTGRLDYPPNGEALLWLLRDIWPRVRARRPDARLLVVGPNPPADAVRVADESVELTGWVAEVRPYFERAAVVVVPMRSGGGTRLKVLDALASGRGIVSTTMGAQGIAVNDGEHLVVADDADAFAAATVRLLEQPAERDRLGRRARELAERTYDWAALGDRLAELYVELASTRS